MQKSRDISLDLTILHKVSFCESFFFTKPHASAHSTQIFAKTIANFFPKPVNFLVITKMFISFHILLTNFPFCNNSEENLKFVNFANNFRENAKTKMFVSTLWFLLYANKFLAVQQQLVQTVLAGVSVQYIANLW